jgi:ADP-heptose:LPS heptosyltransferase
LVIRNDKLGDFMLSWPALASLRANLPDARIAALVPAYTEPLARVCPYIDEVIVDPKLKGDWRSGRGLAKLLKPHQFDAVVTLFSRFDTGLAVWLAGIPLRYSPATKLAQVFYNRRLMQHRSLSARPEYAYNLELAAAFLKEQGIADPTPVLAPYLKFDEQEVSGLKQAFMKSFAIPKGIWLIFVHAGHGGSADNISLQQFAGLIRKLAANKSVYFVLTAGPGEEAQAQSLSALLAGVPHSIHPSSADLVAFAKHLQFCDLFISGSTGPLHIAGALDCRTAAFYPRRRSSTELRWQTVNAAERRLAFAPPESADASDMSAIDMDKAAVEISRQFLEGKR